MVLQLSREARYLAFELCNGDSRLVQADGWSNAQTKPKILLTLDNRGGRSTRAFLLRSRKGRATTVRRTVGQDDEALLAASTLSEDLCTFYCYLFSHALWLWLWLLL